MKHDRLRIVKLHFSIYLLGPLVYTIQTVIAWQLLVRRLSLGNFSPSFDAIVVFMFHQHFTQKTIMTIGLPDKRDGTSDDFDVEAARLFSIHYSLVGL